MPAFPYGHVTTNTTSLANLVTQIGSSNATIWVTTPQNIASNLTIPANISLVFAGNGYLLPSTGVTVTINGLVSTETVGGFSGAIFFTLPSNTGHVIFANNNLMNEVTAEWWNLAHCNGNAGVDAALTINEIVNSIPDYVTVKFKTKATYYFYTQLVISGRTGVKLTATPLIEELPRVTLQGGGNIFNGMIALSSCGHCEISGFWIKDITMGENSGGITIVNDGPPRISTNNTITYNRIENNGNNQFFVGINIAPSGEANNEGMQLIGNFIYGNGNIGTGQGLGIQVGAGSNNHMHYLFRNTMQLLAIGIGSGDSGTVGTTGWSGYTARECIFEQNGIDIYIAHMSYPVLIEHCDTESSTQHLVCGSGGESTITLRAGRLAGCGATGVPIIQIGSGISTVLIESMDFQNFGAGMGPGGTDNRGALIYQIAWTGGAYPNSSVVLRANNYANAILEGLPAANILTRSGSPGTNNMPISTEGDLTGAIIGSFQGLTLNVSAGTLTLTGDGYQRVNSPATISTISLTNLQNYASATNRAMRIYILADGGAITWSTGGNMFRAGATPSGAVAVLLYDPVLGKWVGDYGN